MNTYTLDPNYTPKTLYWLIDPTGLGEQEDPATSHEELIEWAFGSALGQIIEQEYRASTAGLIQDEDEYYMGLKEFAREWLKEIAHENDWQVKEVIR